MSTDQELTNVQKLDTRLEQVLFLLALLLSILYPVYYMRALFLALPLSPLSANVLFYFLLARSWVCVYVCVCVLSFSDRQCFLCVGVGFVSVIKKDLLVCLKQLLLSILDSMCLNCPCSVVFPAFCHLFRRMESQDDDTLFLVLYNKVFSSIKGWHQPQKPENQYCPWSSSVFPKMKWVEGWLQYITW